MSAATLKDRLRSVKSQVPRLAVEKFRMPPSWVGYRWWHEETLREYVQRTGRSEALEVVHPASIHPAPLPHNVPSRDTLIDTRGWWGFSFRDVPERATAETLIATVPDCRVAHYRLEDPGHPFRGDYYVGILNGDQRALNLREIRFRPPHADVLRSGARTERFDRATWVIERVYHNYSHWLTAHLPKLVLLGRKRRLEDILLPPDLPVSYVASLRSIGIEASEHRTYDPLAVQHIGELTVTDTDRFRPELVSEVREVAAPPGRVTPRRRVYISRARATRRKVRNHAAVWDLLRPHGFEQVFMEELPFEAQLELMAETAVLVAPHGAGMANMIFCAPGTQVVEIANLDYPSPNFYALAAALDHEYWFVPATSVGTEHPGLRDIVVQTEALEQVLPTLLAAVPEH
jgi:hypothetical protein